MDVSREDSQRVAVESLNDWQQIKTTFTQASTDRLEQQIKSRGLRGERDALLAHMNQFIEQAFAMSQPNLRVNGRNFENVEENDEMEHFDEALDRRIWSLADNRLAWYKSIAETRRKTPQDVERTFLELHQQESDLDRQGLAFVDNGRIDSEETEEALLQRYPHMQEGFHKTAALGEELNQVISEQQERSERFEVVAAEIKALKP